MSKYVRRTPEVRTCLICGKEFRGPTSQKYCSKECKAAGIKRQKHEHYLYTKALASGRTVEEVKAADEGREIPKRSLDKKLDELKACGKTYAEAQRAETIERWARIEVPSPFEEPAKPAEDRPATEPERRNRMSKHIMSSSVREFLAELKGALTVIASNDDVFGQAIAAYAALLPELEGELCKASHRVFNTGFYYGAPTPASGAEGFTQALEEKGMTMIEYPDSFYDEVLALPGVQDLYKEIDGKVGGLGTTLQEELAK